MKALLLAGAVMSTVFCQAQDTIRVEGITAAFLDVKDLLYIGTKKGTVTRFAQNGDELLYGPLRQSGVTLIDGSNPLRLFVFYEDLQEYVILDRFLTETARYSLSDYTTYAGLCAPSQNNLIWLLDLQNFNLRKIDPSGVINEITIPLQQVLDPDNYEITFMREYQNLLFLADGQRGLYIFDNLGNLLTNLEEEGIDHVSFKENQAIILTDRGMLLYYDLYNGSKKYVELTAKVDFYFEHTYRYYIDENTIAKKP